MVSVSVKNLKRHALEKLCEKHGVSDVHEVKNMDVLIAKLAEKLGGLDKVEMTPGKRVTVKAIYNSLESQADPKTLAEDVNMESDDESDDESVDGSVDGSEDESQDAKPTVAKPPVETADKRAGRRREIAGEHTKAKVRENVDKVKSKQVAKEVAAWLLGLPWDALLSIFNKREDLFFNIVMGKIKVSQLEKMPEFGKNTPFSRMTEEEWDNIFDALQGYPAMVVSEFRKEEYNQDKIPDNPKAKNPGSCDRGFRRWAGKVQRDVLEILSRYDPRFAKPASRTEMAKEIWPAPSSVTVGDSVKAGVAEAAKACERELQAQAEAVKVN